jgi:hypothetical protein
MSQGYTDLDIFYRAFKQTLGQIVKHSTKGKSFTFGNRVEVVMSPEVFKANKERIEQFCETHGYEIQDLNPDNDIVYGKKEFRYVTTFILRRKGWKYRSSI